MSEPATKEDLEKALDATKQDLQNLERDLKQFILEREVQSIRWFIGVFGGLQVAYFAITLTAMWFMLSHLPKLP